MLDKVVVISFFLAAASAGGENPHASYSFSTAHHSPQLSHGTLQSAQYQHPGLGSYANSATSYSSFSSSNTIQGSPLVKTAQVAYAAPLVKAAQVSYAAPLIKTAQIAYSAPVAHISSAPHGISSGASSSYSSINQGSHLQASPLLLKSSPQVLAPVAHHQVVSPYQQQSYQQHSPLLVKAAVPILHSQQAYAAAPANSLHQAGHHQVDYYAHPKYEYKYGVDDSHTGDKKSQQEVRDGDHTQGEYSVLEPDGTVLTVHYSVEGKSGFNAVVSRTGHATHPQQHQQQHVIGKVVALAPAKVVLPTKLNHAQSGYLH